jgi:Domain of unknown function (DUF4177)
VVAILAVVVMTAYAQSRSSKHQTWEYKTVYSRTTGFEGERAFNELGAQGWELVAASGESDTAGVTYVFKRPE